MINAARAYQSEAINSLRSGFAAGHKRQILALGTGTGKTFVAAMLASSANTKGRKVLFLVHLKTLVPQAVRHFEDVGLKVGILRGDDTDWRRSDDVLVASIQTAGTRGVPEDFDGLIIIDEAHVLHQRHLELMQKWDRVPVIGLTATPMREGMGKLFTNLVRGPTIKELIGLGHLVRSRAYAPGAEVILDLLGGVKIRAGEYAQGELEKAMNTKVLVGDIVETWQARGEGRPTILFAVDKAHSKSCASAFQAVGIPAGHIEDTTPDNERRHLFDALRQGDIKVLCSVGVLSVGFDMPAVGCLIMARPTKSLMLHIQQAGRGLRTAPGKEDCIILDHAGNLVVHGLPDDFLVPDLDDGKEVGTKRRDKKERKAAVCKGCGAVIPLDAEQCPECGAKVPRRQSAVTYREASLVEFGSGAKGDKPMPKREFYLQVVGLWEGRGKTPEQARNIAFYACQDRYGTKPMHAWREMPGKAPSETVRSYVRAKAIAYAKSRKAA